MTMNKNKYSISRFECPDCGSNMFVPRQKSRKRKNGHVKDLYCPNCKEEKKMIEVKDYKLFLL